MGRAELLLLASAILVFEFFILTLTEIQLGIKLNNIESKFENFAISAATTYLEKIEVYRFDENLNTNNSLPSGFSMPNSLTPYNSLGWEDTLTSPNDIDDFITTNKLDSIEINDSTYFHYKISCDIYYVNDALVEVNTKTSKKKADVTITDFFEDDTVHFSRIFSYY